MIRLHQMVFRYIDHHMISDVCLHTVTAHHMQPNNTYIHIVMNVRMDVHTLNTQHAYLIKQSLSA